MTTNPGGLRRHIPNAPLLAAAHGRTPTRIPVWFMRQAGRSLPEYRKVRKTIGMVEACFHPEILAEITMQPVRRHDMDAAILFSDIVVPLRAAGINVDIVPGAGPVVDQPIRTVEDIERLPILDHDITEVQQGIGLILEELTDAQALIGFIGAPFTLASYLIEGGSSRNHERTKAMMHAQPEAWHRLMHRIVPTVLAYLDTQIAAGIDAMQLFDSWAGFLSDRDYREFVLPYSTEIFAHIAQYDVPRIHFGVGTGEILGSMAQANPDVMGVDWRVPLDAAARRMHEAAEPKVLQGNLDPAVLFAGEKVIAREIERILREAHRAITSGDAKGHIFNLGHGVLPNTPPEAITQAVEIIHSHHPAGVE